MSDEAPDQEEPGILKLTEEDMRDLIKKVQAQLLKSAKRSRRPPEKT